MLVANEGFVIVYNEGNDRTSYIEVITGSTIGLLATTVPTVVNATVFDTWDEPMDKIVELREANKKNGFMNGMMFPLSVNKKDIFLAKLKGHR